MLCIYEILHPQLTEGFAGMHIHFGQARWISSKLFVCFFKTVFFFFCLVSAIFAKKTAVFGCLTNVLAPSPIALESCSAAQTDRPV